MSAVSAFCGPSAAYLITDGAGFDDEDGRVMEIGSKVIASERLRIAVGTVGRACIVITEDGGRYSPVNDAAKLLEEATTQRLFLAELPNLVRTLHPITAAATGGCFQFTVALWNEKERRAE